MRAVQSLQREVTPDYVIDITTGDRYTTKVHITGHQPLTRPPWSSLHWAQVVLDGHPLNWSCHGFEIDYAYKDTLMVIVFTMKFGDNSMTVSALSENCSWAETDDAG